jgi:ABC-type dipeptide/oligopeptide/nickel transport system permease component
MLILRYAARRITQLIPILFGITVVSFVLIRIVPGDPATQILGNHYTPAAAAAINHDLGLDRSILAQYWLYLKSIFTGDFGHSYFYNQSVGELVSARWIPTLFLVVAAGVLTMAIAIPLGLLSGLRQGRVIDQGARVFFLVGYALPSFLTGILLILFFAVKVPIFPISGFGDGFVQHVQHVFLPAVTLAVPFSTVLIRSLRSRVIENVGSDYVTTARLKGIPWSSVVRKHVLPNSLLPLIVVFGVNLAFLVGGTVVIENVFSIPGLGSLLVSSVSTRDFPVVQALSLVFAVVVLLVNLLTDIVHVALDPRLAAREL